MDYLFIMIVILLVLIALLLIVAMVVSNRRKEGIDATPNYKALFLMGIIFAPVGLVMMILLMILDGGSSIVFGLPLLGIGLSYIAIGLGNRDKWEKKEYSV